MHTLMRFSQTLAVCSRLNEHDASRWVSGVSGTGMLENLSNALAKPKFESKEYHAYRKYDLHACLDRSSIGDDLCHIMTIID